MPAKPKPASPAVSTVTLSMSAASITTNPGVAGRVLVTAAGVFEREILDSLATEFDVGTLIDAVGEEVITEELDRRRRAQS